jgi:hypothetical protein
MRMTSLKVIVTGLIGQHPKLGGMTWHYLNYVLGFAKLGHDVYYLEDSGQWPYRLDGGASANDWIAYDCSANVQYLNNVLSRFGLRDQWAYRFPIDSRWYGLSDFRRKELLDSADLLINVSGSLVDPAAYRRVKKLVYIDTDPVFTQIKVARGRPGWTHRTVDFCMRMFPSRLQGVESTAWLPRHLAKVWKDTAKTDAYLERLDFCSFRQRVDTHDMHFSFGDRIPAAMAETDYKWLPTWQPVVLSEWRTSTVPRDAFTTVMNWTSYKPLYHRGRPYGQKDVEFSRFLELPSRVPEATLEVALSKKEHVKWQTVDKDISPALKEMALRHSEWNTRDLLDYAGWSVVDAVEACHDLDSYRSYVASSKAEWSVAKNGYVVGQPGWFSDRSACYLACGRPVIVQDTGFGESLPTGRGILVFSNMEQAVDAVHDVQANYKLHANAAREIAEEYFDSDRVLNTLLNQALGQQSASDIASVIPKESVVPSPRWEA